MKIEIKTKMKYNQNWNVDRTRPKERNITTTERIGQRDSSATQDEMTNGKSTRKTTLYATLVKINKKK